MKYLKHLTLLVLAFSLFSCSEQNEKANTQDNISKKQETVAENKIEVIDFHTSHRCKTCRAIEANTVYTLDTYFADLLKSDKITFVTVNVDDALNYTLAEKFQAAGTSLFLNVIVDGKETQIDLTDFAFANGTNKEKFSSELKVLLEKEVNKI